jgi:hypothetical protein
MYTKGVQTAEVISEKGTQIGGDIRETIVDQMPDAETMRLARKNARKMLGLKKKATFKGAVHKSAKIGKMMTKKVRDFIHS